jgi:hypothetical protein
VIGTANAVSWIMTQDVTLRGEQAGRRHAGALREALVRTDHQLQQFTRHRPFMATFLAVGAGFLVGRLLSRRRW